MDMSQYLDIFLEESLENLENLNQGILELENNPEDKDTINSIFRVAHTLKGMAGSMGFTDIANLTHKMENVLDKFRHDELKVTSDVVTVLFKCLDTLEQMIHNVQEGIDDKIEIDEIINTLISIEKGEGIPGAQEITPEVDALGSEYDFSLNEYDKNIIKEAKEKGYSVYKITINIYPDCILKAARAFLAYKTLEDMGDIVKCTPSVEDLEQENFDRTFGVVLVTEKEEDVIREAMKSVSELESIVMESLEEDEEAVNEIEEVKENNIVADVKKNSEKAVKEEEKSSKKVNQSVRVDLERLDKLMNLVGELVMHRTRLEQISANHKLTDLHETLEQVGRISSDLQDLVMKVRMVPVERVFNRFPRLVRDLANELGKNIHLIVEGEGTELDRTVIDEIGEPLVHLIRNSADHGIESIEERKKAGKSEEGTIKLIAYQEGNKAIIRVEDDGKGIDVEKVKRKAESLSIDTEGMSDNDIRALIFMQGFSTSEKVTDVSGRGVGMDVVRTKISAIGGSIEVVSEEGVGSSIIIRLPLTLSIIQALLVKVHEETFAISLGFIDRVININVNEIKKTNNKEIIVYRENVIPIIRVAERLNLDESENEEKFLVMVNVGEKTVGLLVDDLFGQQEIVIKSMGGTLQNLKEYVGATVLGDGLVTLILDVAALV
ncbi:chemotaxis protein CheA [Clostridium cylindrosporum]|uniref:Chemotaxis protein CheA n=1 Tax=Clostridium cylindrosporum DSM 605 TaxID=1121307 RepID=A0A0J8DBI8_CLOCY|nr:chemotaxis protein CheA [Clostridium cylindrosporum]KMT21679.1 chemotaxis protein CheA [Clostridium cylindrosporum DSM 605]